MAWKRGGIRSWLEIIKSHGRGPWHEEEVITVSSKGDRSRNMTVFLPRPVRRFKQQVPKGKIRKGKKLSGEGKIRKARPVKAKGSSRVR